MPNGRVVALRVPNGAKLSRKDIDEYTKFVGIYGAKGLAYIKVNDVNNLSNGEDSGLQSPIVKFLSKGCLKNIIERTGAQNGDLIFFGADKAKVVNEAIGALRIKIGHEHGAADGYFVDEWKPLWVVDFPMFEYDEEENRYTAMHHPFTSPKAGHEDLMETQPENCIYVGDAERDIQAGRIAGMKTILAAWGYIAPSDTPEAWGYHASAANPMQILDILRTFQAA